MDQAFTTTAGTFELIALNLCTQLLAFQESITKRESGAQFPTIQETGMLCKLINCLDKLRKLAAPFKAATTFNNFFKFLATDDKELAALVKARYKAFTEQSATSEPIPTAENAVTVPNTAVAPPTEKAPTVVMQPQKLEMNRVFDENYIILRSAPHPPVYSSEPPFREDNLEKHKSLILNNSVDWHHTVRIEGHIRNACWAQYNLFQFLLPPSDRRFYHQEINFMKIFNIGQVSQAIARFCHENRIR